MNEEKKQGAGEKKEAPKGKGYRFKAVSDCIYKGGYVRAGTVIVLADEKAPPHFVSLE